MRVNTPSVTTSIRVRLPTLVSSRMRKPTVSPTRSPSVAAIRSATARVASRRGSSMTMRLPRAHGSSSSASGTTVLLPAPGGATTTALPPVRSAAARGLRASSIGRPERMGARAPCARLTLGARAARELEQRAGALYDGHVDDPAVERRRSAAAPLGFLVGRDDARGVRDFLRRRREAFVQRVDLLGMDRELSFEADALRAQ